MPSLYVDTAFYIASLIERDQLHGRAVELGTRLREQPLVTSDAVLAEVMADTSELGPHARSQAVALVRGLRIDPLVTVVRYSDRLFDDAVDLYEAGTDKEFSHTDCVGMIICREREITDVLTHDHHFEQESFTTLL